MHFLGKGCQKSEHYRQTDAETDVTENISSPHLQMVIIQNIWEALTIHKQGCPQDVKSQDWDETETVNLQDRDETETYQKTYRDRSVAVWKH